MTDPVNKKRNNTSNTVAANSLAIAQLARSVGELAEQNKEMNDSLREVILSNKLIEQDSINRLDSLTKTTEAIHEQNVILSGRLDLLERAEERRVGAEVAKANTLKKSLGILTLAVSIVAVVHSIFK